MRLSTAFALLAAGLFSGHVKGEDHLVAIANFAFVPDTLTIDPGDTVTWVNGDFASHTVTSSLGLWDSGSFGIGDTFSRTFPVAGSFSYYCAIHPSMTGSITVRGGTGATTVNLAPFQRFDWSDSIIVFSAPDDVLETEPIYDDEEVFLRWAVVNWSPSEDVTQTFYTHIFVDGQLKSSWRRDGLPADTWNSDDPLPIGMLSAGTHTLRIVVDATDAVSETDESDNADERTFTVLSSGGPPETTVNLAPYHRDEWADKIIAFSTPDDVLESDPIYDDQEVYLRWAVVNWSPDEDVLQTFHTEIFVDGQLKADWQRNGLAANTWNSNDAFAIGRLTAGTHTLRMAVDAGDAVAESDENDNTYERTITVLARTPSGLPNLVPYTPSGWSDKIVVSTTSGDHQGTGPFYADKDLFLHWAISNLSLDHDVTVPTVTRIYVNGTLETEVTSDDVPKNFHWTWSDYNLGRLPAGTHVLRVEVDATDSAVESDETDNTYERTIVISPVGSGASEHTVEIVDFKFSPSILIINPGDRVTWVNKDAAPHTATSDSGVWNSETLAQSQTYSFTFDSAGSFPYHCAIHPSMTGTIVVSSGDPDGNPNLAPYKRGDWSDRIIVSNRDNDNQDREPLLDAQELFLSWTVSNISLTHDVGQPFITRLYLDDRLEREESIDSLARDSYSSRLGHSIGLLPAGTHRVRLEVDASDAISETDEADNVYEREFLVQASAGPQAPSVQMTEPASNSSFTAPATIVLGAEAGDEDGTIVKVEFFHSNTKIGEDATAPYSYKWKDVAAGSYVLTARAVDDTGLSASSEPVPITVAAPSTPLVTVTQSAGAYQSPGMVSVQGSVSYPVDQPLLSLRWRPVLPAGWVLQAASGEGSPEVQLGEIVLIGSLGANPLNFSFTVQVPAGEAGARELRGEIEFQLIGMVNPASALAQPDPLVINAAPAATLPPTITTQPASQNAELGENVTFQVVATGSEPLAYQWRLNGTNIPRATTATLIRNSVTTDDAGRYTVVVSNDAGVVISQPAILTIGPAPPRLDTVALLSGQGLRFTLTGKPGATFRIEVSDDLVEWHELLTLPSASGSLTFTDSEALGLSRRYYRAIQIGP